MRVVALRVAALLAGWLVAGEARAVIAGDPAENSAAHVIITHGGGFCTGTWIAPRLVLTAAHCVVRSPMAILTVRGAVKSAPIPVVKSILNPGYRPAEWAKRRVTADLAILKVAQAQGGVVLPLAASGIPAAGSRLRIVGFGPQREGDLASMGQLRQARLTVVGRPGSLQIRLSGQGQGACVGDSGGPALTGEGGTPAIVGVISWTTGPQGRACGDLTGLVPVATHRQWIEQVIAGETP